MTTSMETTKAEIARFLSGSSPSVLCVTGRWGVGKTFLWNDVLKELRKSKELSLTRYSYVSLFGLNSLDDLKSSIFENMDWLDQDTSSFSEIGKASAKAIAARAKKLSNLAGGLPVVGPLFAKARPLYFSAIQNQIVCIDDLERRSRNLDIRDVLGLISFLREHRACKVAFLLNAEKLGENKAEFDELLEKVVEVKVVLAPTARESASIALPGTDSVSVALRAHCETLSIRNIRLIKQIERLARRIDEVVANFPQSIRDQATHSITLFAWSKYGGENAPTFEFLKGSSLERYFARRHGNQEQPKEQAEWESLLENYKFRRSDEFDKSLMKYVDSMILDVDDIRREAERLQEQQRLGYLNNQFGEAWAAFHDSFDDDEDAVVQQIIDRSKKAYEVISLANLNEAVLMLKSLGRDKEAKDIISYFAEKKTVAGYWNPEQDPFMRGTFDPDIAAVLAQKKAKEPEEFDIAETLISAGKDYDPAEIAKLATVTAKEYCDLISASRGDRLRTLVLSALEFRRISNASEDMRRVISLMEEALRMIGRRSKLNALRLQKYGVSVENNAAGAERGRNGLDERSGNLPEHD